eukprot:scaffold13555_cov38-Cyclotella_meneghiniana.AAC.4
MSCLTLDVADAVAQSRLPWCDDEANVSRSGERGENVPRARGEGGERATKNKNRQARYGTGFLAIWDVQTSQKTAQNTGLLAFARVDSEKPKPKLNSS